MEPKPYLDDPAYLIYPDGKVWSTKTNKFLSPFLSQQGYFRVSLSNHKKYFVHRLVAETFIPNPNNFPQINHKDENKQNNKVENLEWVTNKQNMNYGTRNNRAGNTSKQTYEKIWKNSRRKPNIKPVTMCDPNTHEEIQDFISAAEAARFLGKTNKHAHQNISNCVNGRSKTAYGYWWKFSKKPIDSFLEEC